MTPWTEQQKSEWTKKQTLKRSYQEDVLSQIEKIQADEVFEIERYGALSSDPGRYPLHAVKYGLSRKSKPNILVTGGVHGYETSGVKGALKFILENLHTYIDHFNFLVVPCVSPWSYETINRLNLVMENPNREFIEGGKAEESQLLMQYISEQGLSFDGHIDLHETTNSDKVFLPEEYAKNGKALSADDIDIPDGYYLIGISGFDKKALEQSIIKSVEKITHIAEADSSGEILETPLSHRGVIHKDIPGLCAQLTDAKSKLGAFTTEMYPDSPRFASKSQSQIEDLCSAAQVASLRGALDFWKESGGKKVLNS